ncbi:MAG: hypothetical protein ABTQ28_00275, partial [Thauera sp.]
PLSGEGRGEEVNRPSRRRHKSPAKPHQVRLASVSSQPERAPISAGTAQGHDYLFYPEKRLYVGRIPIKPATNSNRI